MRLVAEKVKKKDKNFYASNWLFAQTTHVDIAPLKFIMRGRVQELVIYFKFHENRFRGFAAVWGLKSPSPIDKAHGLYNSLYYTVQAGITITQLVLKPISST